MISQLQSTDSPAHGHRRSTDHGAGRQDFSSVQSKEIQSLSWSYWCNCSTQVDSGWKGLRLEGSLAQPPAQSRTSYRVRPVRSRLYLVRLWIGWRWHNLSGLPAPLLDYPPGETISPYIQSGYKLQAQPCLSMCPDFSSITRRHRRIDSATSPCIASLVTSLCTLEPCFFCSFLKSLLRRTATIQATNRVTGDILEKEV